MWILCLLFFSKFRNSSFIILLSSYLSSLFWNYFFILHSSISFYIFICLFGALLLFCWNVFILWVHWAMNPTIRFSVFLKLITAKILLLCMRLIACISYNLPPIFFMRWNLFHLIDIFLNIEKIKYLTILYDNTNFLNIK